MSVINGRLAGRLLVGPQCRSEVARREARGAGDAVAAMAIRVRDD